jgi:hypothetical protein
MIYASQIRLSEADEDPRLELKYYKENLPPTNTLAYSASYEDQKVFKQRSMLVKYVWVRQAKALG